MGALTASASAVWDVASHAFRTSSRVAPVHIVATLLVAYGVYVVARSHRGGKSFVAWAFPREIYRHASHRTDLKLFALGQVLSFVGFFKLVTVTTVVASLTMRLVESVVPRGPTLGVVGITFVLFATADFTTYWVHRLHHERRRLWPFHAVHHSAEVMTPITLYRKHPVYDVFSTAAKGVLGGAAQGLLLAVFVDSISISLIAGANAAYFLFNLAGSNLRHSHIWLGYGPILSRIFISPAQHQIHHSTAPEHFDKNYGEVFAVWDWVFGTLYVPSERQTLRFGLADSQGNPVEQPHPDLRSALIVPLREALASKRSDTTEARRVPVPTPAPVGSGE